MNKNKLKGLLWYRLRFTLPTRQYIRSIFVYQANRRIELNRWFELNDPTIADYVDDTWIVEGVSDKGIAVSNISSRHTTTIPYDHIISFYEDPSHSDGVKHGILDLRCRIELNGNNLDLVLMPEYQVRDLIKQGVLNPN